MYIFGFSDIISTSVFHSKTVVRRWWTDLSKLKYLLVNQDLLPAVYSKVAFAKSLLASGEALNATQAAKMAGISRSAYYKNKDGIFELEYKKGELKSSTFFSKYELSPEAQLITPQRKRATSKKVYINKPDEKIIEKYNIATNRLQDGLCLSETTIIRPSEIINEKQGLYEPTVRIAQKQEDGNWKTILSEAFIGSGFQVYRFTIDVNNNKIIEEKSLGVKIPNLYSEPYYTIP